ncbi:MAG: hypothetical protein ACRDF7_04155 [Candidatus Limnocylindrales bacterium]
MVVDREMDPVPADGAVEVDLETGDPVTANGSDPTEHLRVEMDELARAFALIADDQRSGLEPIEPGQALAPQDGVHGAVRQARFPGEDVRSDAQLAPPRAQAGDELGRMTTGLPMDRARAVGEEPDLGAVPPLRAGLAADAGSSGGGRDRPASTDPIGQERPTAGVSRALGWAIEGSFFDCGSDTNSRG